MSLTDGQTDRQTDGQSTYCGTTALCVASRGKIGRFVMYVSVLHVFGLYLQSTVREL